MTDNIVSPKWYIIPANTPIKLYFYLDGKVQMVEILTDKECIMINFDRINDPLDHDDIIRFLIEGYVIWMAVRESRIIEYRDHT